MTLIKSRAHNGIKDTIRTDASNLSCRTKTRLFVGDQYLSNDRYVVPYSLPNPFARFSKPEIIRRQIDTTRFAPMPSRNQILWDRGLDEHLCEPAYYDDAPASGERISFSCFYSSSSSSSSSSESSFPRVSSKLLGTTPCTPDFSRIA